MTEHFIIGGAQRSGTTFLYDLLDRHPDIEMARPARPEPKFFLSDGRSRDAYARLFSSGTARWRGEKSTSYLERPDAIARIQHTLPACRMIFALRDPVERAISNYWFSVAHGAEQASMEDAFLREDERCRDYDPSRFSVSPFAYVRRGDYATLLEPFLDAFGAGRVHLLLLEDFVKKPSSVRALLSFLDLDGDAEELLANTPPTNEAVRGQEIDPHLRQFLVQRYEKSNRLLSERFGLDLSAWMHSDDRHAATA